jgi:hypothetical protein
MSIRIPAVGVAALIGEATTFGARGLETGGFLLAPRTATVGANPAVAAVALAGDTGISRGRDMFQVSGHALDRIFTFADDHGLWIPALLHSHRAGALLSATDQRHGLGVDGFISAVIPEYSGPPRDLARWGWWRFESGRWCGAAPGRTTGGTVEVLRFDEGGIRGA